MQQALLARAACSGAIVLAAGLAAPRSCEGSALRPLECDPARVVGPAGCLKCHQREVEQWTATPHSQTFESLQRAPEAKAIVERLGLRSVKRNDVCTECHYTQQEIDGHARIVAGISCESCHGAAQGWVDRHGDYGGPQATRETETPAHRDQRRADSIAAGMNNPSNLYLIARQCLACHTSPREDLVNVGGHRAGSPDFELVAWSQGMIRHNFLRGGQTVNVPSSQERLRVMYVVGVLADLEASLRATALATQRAEFGVAAARRAARQKKRLYEIARLVDNSLLREALATAVDAPLELRRREELEAAADRLGELAYEVAAAESGGAWAALDPLLPAEADFRWRSHRGEAAAPAASP